MGPKVKHRINLCFIYTCIHSLKVILCNILSEPVFWLQQFIWGHKWIFHLGCHVSTQKSFGIEAFQIWDLGMLNLSLYFFLSFSLLAMLFLQIFIMATSCNTQNVRCSKWGPVLMIPTILMISVWFWKWWWIFSG